MQKSSKILENSQEVMEILSQFQKILLKSSKDFKFSCETQGDSIKIEVLIQKDSVKTEEEGWISNEGNSTCTWPDGYGLTANTEIEVRRYNGSLLKGRVGDFGASWGDGGSSIDIQEFRIVK